jgi:hypothetical protein
VRPTLRRSYAEFDQMSIADGPFSAFSWGIGQEYAGLA